VLVAVVEVVEVVEGVVRAVVADAARFVVPHAGANRSTAAERPTTTRPRVLDTSMLPPGKAP
jgi:hypothetical protein